MASEPILADLITQTLIQAQVKPGDIEIVMTTGSGVAAVDAAEQKAIAAIWSGATKPMVASTATRWGNLMEAGGVAEIGFLQTCYANKSVPESAMSEKSAVSAQNLNTERRKAAILRATPWGEYTCLIVEMAKP
jgi:3-oxoacyl-(acyl-carrier-protein) synthase